MKAFSYLFFLLLLFSFFSTASAQRLTGISTQWSDSFAEWVLYTDVEGEQGELRLRWGAEADRSAWDYRLGDHTGTIRAKWPDRFDEWEVRGDNVVATARALWRNDPREWRLTGPAGTIKWTSRYGNVFDEWLTTTDQLGHLQMYTAYEGDPRDWVIIDELDPRVSLPEKILLAFLTILTSTPR